MMVSEEQSSVRRPIVRPAIVRRMAAEGTSRLDIARRLRLGYDAVAMLVPETGGTDTRQPRVLGNA